MPAPVVAALFGGEFTALTILEFTAKYGPRVGRYVAKLIESIKAGKEPTKEEWEVFWKLLEEDRQPSYFDLFPHSRHPSNPTPAS